MSDSTDKIRGTSKRFKIAIALTVLFTVSLLAANHALWLTRTVLNTDSFVAALAPLPKDENVSLALAEQVADALIAQFQVQESISEALPDGVSFIAAPITDGIRGLTSDAAVEIVRSDAFTTVWTAAIRGTHSVAVAFVGALDDGLLSEQDGVVVLDLGELGRTLAEDLDFEGLGIIGSSDRQLTVELFEAGDGGAIHWVVDLMRSIRWALMALTVALGIAIFAVADDKRRILGWFGGATVVAMVISLIDVRYAKVAVTGGISDAVQRAGAESAWDIVFRQLNQQTLTVLLIGALLMAVSWLFGDSTRAVVLRSRADSRVDSAASAFKETALGRFIASNPGPTNMVAALLAALLLLFGPTLSLLGFIVVVVVLSVVIAGVTALSRPSD